MGISAAPAIVWEIPMVALSDNGKCNPFSLSLTPTNPASVFLTHSLLSATCLWLCLFLFLMDFCSTFLFVFFWHYDSQTPLPLSVRQIWYDLTLIRWNRSLIIHCRVGCLSDPLTVVKSDCELLSRLSLSKCQASESEVKTCIVLNHFELEKVNSWWEKSILLNSSGDKPGSWKFKAALKADLQFLRS